MPSLALPPRLHSKSPFVLQAQEHVGLVVCSASIHMLLCHRELCTGCRRALRTWLGALQGLLLLGVSLKGPLLRRSRALWLQRGLRGQPTQSTTQLRHGQVWLPASGLPCSCSCLGPASAPVRRAMACCRRGPSTLLSRSGQAGSLLPASLSLDLLLRLLWGLISHESEHAAESSQPADRELLAWRLHSSRASRAASRGDCSRDRSACSGQGLSVS